MDGGLDTQTSGGSAQKVKMDGAHASSHGWRVVATGFPSGVVKWSGDFLDEIVCARDKRILRVIAVAALGEVD